LDWISESIIFNFQIWIGYRLYEKVSDWNRIAKFPYPCTTDANMGVGRIFPGGATKTFLQNFSRGGPKVVKFDFFSVRLSKSRGALAPPSDAHVCRARLKGRGARGNFYRWAPMT